MKGTDDGAPWHSHCGLNEKRAVAAAEELFKVVSEHTAWLFFCFRAGFFFLQSEDELLIFISHTKAALLSFCICRVRKQQLSLIWKMWIILQTVALSFLCQRLCFIVTLLSLSLHLSEKTKATNQLYSIKKIIFSRERQSIHLTSIVEEIFNIVFYELNNDQKDDFDYLLVGYKMRLNFVTSGPNVGHWTIRCRAAGYLIC